MEIKLIEFIFRVASIADLPRLLVLEQRIIESERPYDPDIRESEVSYYDIGYLISDNNSYLLVVETNGEIIGSGYAQVRQSKSSHTHDVHCYLGFIYLDKEFRGKSLGNKILDNLKEWGVKQGIRHFQLDVYSENRAAIRAYEKAGFSKVSVKMEYST